MDEWHAEWGSEWTGETAVDAVVTVSARRIGKRIQPGDLLFSETGGARAYVSRSPDDDFARMPVPDTYCPNLVTGAGFSSVVTDVYRYIPQGDVDTSKAWKLSHRTGKIELSHSVYPNMDFTLQVEGRVISKHGSYLRNGIGKSFDGVGCCLNIAGRLVIAAHGWMEHYMPRPEWENRYNGPAILFLIPSSPDPIYLDMIPVDDKVKVIRYRIHRQGSQIRFYWQDTNGTFIPTGWYPVASAAATLWFEGIQVHGGL